VKEELKAALEEIEVPPDNNSQCWAKKLPDDALEFLKAVEQMYLNGKRVNRRTVAVKLNELFDIPGRPINQGMVDRHFARPGKGCVCWKERDYLEQS